MPANPKVDTKIWKREKSEDMMLVLVVAYKEGNGNLKGTWDRY